MKINLKRAMSAAAATALTATCTLSNVYAGSFNLPVDSIAAIEINRLAAASDAGVSYAIPEFKNLIGQDTEEFEDLSPVAGYSAIESSIELLDKSLTLPEKFDMREEGLISSVKNQGQYGTCWTFASAASAESSLLPYIPSINLAEWHTSYYPYSGGDQIDLSDKSLSEILNYGGTAYVVTNLWAQWMGPIYENSMPYGDESLFSNESAVAEYRNASDFHLENAYMFDYDKNRTNKEEVDSLIKQFISNGQAVDVSFYTNSSKTFNSTNSSSYSTMKPKYANHSVTIAGWDDNYSASNFSAYKETNGTLVRPQNNGAWLVKNSWGTGHADGGYFWLSYEDASLCEFAVFELGEKENYAEIYQHDSFVPTQSMSADDDVDINQPSYMANVFTADNSGQLEAISTYINNPGTEYEIIIYTDLEDPSDPDSGTPSSVTSGKSELTGYVTIELDKNVVIQENELFSVSVKLYCDDSKFVLPLETCMLLENKNDGTLSMLSKYTDYDTICEYTGMNESFYSEDGDDWTDVTEKNYEYTDEEKLELLEAVIQENGEDMTTTQIEQYRALFESGDLKIVMGNMALKAFVNPVNTVDFSHISGNVPADEKVELSSKNGEDIYFSINDGAYTLYSEPITVTEKTIISATVDNTTYTEKQYAPAMAEFMDIGYKTNLKYSSANAEYAERIDESTYAISLTGDKNEIALMPLSAADIYLNGVLIETNKFTDAIDLDFGLNAVVFTLEQENKQTNQITLNIYRNLVDIDLETETITTLGVQSLTADNGKTFVEGESVSEYAGQTLKALVSGEIIEVLVPERAVVPELNIDYLNETLNFIPNEIADNTLYSVKSNPQNSDYVSAKSRLIDGRNITSGMIMNKAFRIIPGETVTIKIASGDGKFASTPVTVKIPSAGKAPTANPEYTVTNGTINLEYSDILEYGVFTGNVTQKDLNSMAKEFGYDVQTYSNLLMKRYGANNTDELLLMLGAEWDTIFKIDAGNKSNVKIAVRQYSEYEKFSSCAYILEIVVPQMMKGDVNDDGVVNAVDASYVLSYYALTSTGKEPNLVGEQVEAADYNEDGVVNAIDASAILTYYAMTATEI